MNDEQLHGFLSGLKSDGAEAKSADTPINLALEQRLLQTQRKMNMNRRRTKFAIALAAVVFLGGAGFVLAGGESMLMRQDGSGEQSGEWREGPILRHIHQVLRHIHDHFAPHGGDRIERELHSYEGTGEER